MFDRMKRTLAAGAAAAAAALTLGASPAWAAQDYVADVQADAGQPQEERSVSLTAGRDYILGVNGTAGEVSLRDPQGRVVVRLPADRFASSTFRAAFTATYRLAARSGRTSSGGPGIADGSLYTDCRGNRQTLCTLGLGLGETGFIADPADVDWYRVRLTKGQRYRFAAVPTGGLGLLTLRAPSGGLIRRVAVGDDGAAIEYRAPATGTYFLATSIDTSRGVDPYTYELSVERR